MPGKHGSLASRFWPKVNRDGPVPPHRPELGACWVWTAAVGRSDGYGRIGVDNGKAMLAHRASWAIHFGAAPPEMRVCHHCDNRACVRPDHLFLGTDADNQRDCVLKGRSAFGDRRPNARLSFAAVRDIRQRVAAGERTGELARVYGVTHSLISMVVSGKRWKERAA